MARAGDELVTPATGVRTVFRKTARETSGELLQVDWIGEPGWTTGPDHIHPRQEERFEVLSGRLGLRVEGVERVLGEGEVIVAPAGSAHAAWNAGDANVIQQGLSAGLLDELQIHRGPVLVGDAVRLFNHIGKEHIELENTRVGDSTRVTHLGYRVEKEG